MANQIKILGTLLAVVDNDIVDKGSSDGDYTIKMIDAHAVREFSGKYNTLAVYENDQIARFTNSVVAENNTTDGLDSNGWQEGAGGPDSGTLPTNVFAISVEYISKLGTVANVFVAIKSTSEIRMANLTLGESVVLPIAEGLTQANVLIGASAYTDGTHEATVNVLIVGNAEVGLISHWIGDNESGGSIVNEVAGKPSLVVPATNNTFFDSHTAWWTANWGVAGAKATGTINNTNSNYSIVMAFRNGDGYSALYNQRLLSAKDTGNTERLDMLTYPKDDNTKAFESSVVAIGSDNLPVVTIGSINTDNIVTIIFEAPDIKIYRNGSLKGTLSNVFAQCALDGEFSFLAWYGGGSNSSRAAAVAEAKIFSGVVSDTQRIIAENAMATTYGITF